VCENTLGCLITTEPCATCEQTNTAHGEVPGAPSAGGVYVGEMSVLALLLSELLRTAKFRGDSGDITISVCITF
jgi:hypothetical protein